MPVDDKGEIIREEAKKPDYGLDASKYKTNLDMDDPAAGVVKPPEEEESKFGILNYSLLVVADGATKRRFTAAS